MLKIVQSPAQVLSTPAEPVKQFDSKLVSLIDQMEETLDAQSDPEGVGLAAPQVGIGKAIFIMRPKPESSLEVCINPKILEVEEDKKNTAKPKKTNKKTPLEGCLSIPRIWSPVRRAKKVLLEYQNEQGESQSKWFSGFEAVIVQHEVDHLQGVLFTQRALEQKGQLYEEVDGELKKLDY